MVVFLREEGLVIVGVFGLVVLRLVMVVIMVAVAVVVVFDLVVVLVVLINVFMQDRSKVEAEVPEPGVLGFKGDLWPYSIEKLKQLK